MLCFYFCSCRQKYDRADLLRRIQSKCKFRLEAQRREYTREGRSWRHVADAMKRYVLCIFLHFCVIMVQCFLVPALSSLSENPHLQLTTCLILFTFFKTVFQE